ncbi:TIGR01459 family HAD-type hydrolase [Magnetospirillum sp. UT-4]|uniref:TIGR01459 family HAD-type hydrolase n=1 Tax=Magnetospirillum sp. UT-4 TaxID=2681467 RepID=UPI00137E89A6|nr:TIGR01459 family HAD-type hydrolase [Magnetospirillum sp. UT-4]CAA7619392.1 Predicted sugar phosphatase of the HAD superfamily [Magnetospirillum sp. UT-4]
MRVPLIPGLAALAEQADGYLLDLWGVIHDGVVAYAGAGETLRAIRAAGKRTLLLSNAPRRGATLVEQLSRLGLPRHLYDEVLSSGDAVHLELERRSDPFFADLGRRLYHMGPERDTSVFDGLDYRSVGIDEADFIVNTGPVDLEETIAEYQPVLDRAIARRLPMVCANPDHVVMRQGRAIMCAGAIASHYQAMGGRVAMRGKPDPAIYTVALERLGCAADRVLAVGDALHTDVKGANAAGLRAVFVTQGIHAAELGIEPGAEPEPARLAEVVAAHGEIPLAAMATFRW